MLYYSSAPQTPRSVVFQCTPFEPPSEVETPDEYLGFLRAAYRQNPRPFVALARDGRDRQLTLYSADRPDLVAVLYEAIVGVARQRGWEIDGGELARRPKNLSGRYFRP